MAQPPVANEIRPISHQSTNDRISELVLPHLRSDARIVDVGAGEGYFSKLMGEYVRNALGASPAQLLSACDLFPEYFRYPDIQCDPILEGGRLPYDDSSFDVACSLEVVEHVEDQFTFTRELYRILRPGGVAIISTPNVLNVNSRVRNLHSGFTVLFDPLMLSSTDPVHTSGHINPVSYYYLAYQLHRAGFRTVTLDYDRFKSSAKFLLALWGPFISIGNALFRRKLGRNKPDVARENRDILSALNGYRLLTSRSVIVVATK